MYQPVCISTFKLEENFWKTDVKLIDDRKGGVPNSLFYWTKLIITLGKQLRQYVSFGSTIRTKHAAFLSSYQEGLYG